MTWAAIIDAAAAKWPQTDAMGRTLADDAADLIESRQVRETRSGAWRVDAAGAAANVAGDGSGYGDGYGDGYGSGDGSGDGYGYGYGYGYGSGSGYGSG